MPAGDVRGATYLTETLMRSLSITAILFAISLGCAFAEDEPSVPDSSEAGAAAAADASEPAAGDPADTSSASPDSAATDSDGK